LPQARRHLLVQFVVRIETSRPRPDNLTTITPK